MPSFPKKGIAILDTDELETGESKTFKLTDGEESLPCFVVRWQGELQAFVNRCRHIPMTMDWVENQFLTEDGEFILCPTHGALFQPDTGACVGGPAYGKSLFRVPLVTRDGQVFAQWPSLEEED